MSKGETVVRFFVREVTGVEVQLDLLLGGPVDPTLKMFNFDFITINGTVEFSVKSVQVQPMLARNQRVGKLQVAAQLVWRSCPARIVPRYR